MNRIADLRKKINLTQKQLAEKLGINAVSLSRYETGEREPSFEILQKMSELFGNVSINYIMGQEDVQSYHFLDHFIFLYNNDAIFHNDKLIEHLQDKNSTIYDIISNLSQLKELYKNQNKLQIAISLLENTSNSIKDSTLEALKDDLATLDSKIELYESIWKSFVKKFDDKK